MQGITYFKCPENHGMFVRQTQIEAVKTPKKAASGGTASPGKSPVTKPRVTRSAASSTASATDSQAATAAASHTHSPSSSRRSSVSSQSASAADAAPSSTAAAAPQLPPTVMETAGEAANNTPASTPVKTAAAPPPQPQAQAPSQPPPPAQTQPPPQLSPQPSSITIPLRSASEAEADPVRVRELEMLRKQVDTMHQYKQNWMEKQQQMQKTISELERNAQMEHERLESELVLQTETAELASLDKQVAEEKVCWSAAAAGGGGDRRARTGRLSVLRP